MKIKSILLAAMLAASCVGGALAAPGPVVMTQTSAQHWSAAFGNTPLIGAFSDIFTFTPAVPFGSSAGVYLFNLALDGNGLFNPNFSITFGASDLSGNPLTLFNGGPFPQGGVSVPNISGPLTLHITGVSNGGSYSGVLNVMTPVPEPLTYGMLLGGLAVVGLMARRRKDA
ncbi:FxDxF family PEP-CTERM protein [Janthinobacterium sp.]|uniref:FxDxF family PEP-CTERM protein n=1 Tax=Janthinobacterium sp. TaxID=1871054 RepID=UPI00293D864D|nr:FxDxF family PEP-CTERM protein [Janthinobacterium sp.]